MKFKEILNSFPPPEFLNIPYAGLSISDSAIRCMQFSRKNASLSVDFYTERPLSPGIVTSGTINNVDEIANILQNLKKETGISFVKASLPEEKAYLFTTKIPVVDHKYVRGVIESKIEENVPLPAADLIFGYALMNPDDVKDHLEIVVSAFPIEIVNTYVEAVGKADLSLISLEIESQAVARSLLPKHSEGSHIIVYFGKGKMGLYVESDAIIQFTSTVSTKGESLENPDFLVQEIKKLIGYWHTVGNGEEKEIKSVIISGEDFGESLAPYLSSHLKIPVSLGNIWTNVFDTTDTVPPIPFIESLRYAAAAGLAIPLNILI